MNGGWFLLLIVSLSVAEQVSALHHVTVEDTKKGIQAAWKLFLRFEEGKLTAAQVENTHESIKLASNKGKMEMSCWVDQNRYRFNCGVGKSYLLNEDKVEKLKVQFKSLITCPNRARIRNVEWKEQIKLYQANAVCKGNKYLFNYHIPVDKKNGLRFFTALFSSST